MKQIGKELKKCGIYMIINLINGNRYIGSSKNIQQRLQTHRSNLRNNHHCNIHLQNAWNKYGEAKFDYSILEFCEENIRINREQYYVNTLKPEYNISIEIVELPSNSIESKLKLSRTRKQRIAEGLIKKNHCTRIFVYNLQGIFIKEFNSKVDACRELGLTRSGISKTLKGEQKQHHGFLLFKEKQDFVIPYKIHKNSHHKREADKEWYEIHNCYSFRPFIWSFII